MTFWQEVAWSGVMLAVGLTLELLIDIWRDRYKVTRREDGEERHSQ